MILKYDYKKFTLDDIINEKTIIIPSFQRNIVWKDKKRQEFIKTLLKGNPFGSILVHEDKVSGGKIKYTLIDGLQRISTIKDFNNNPYKYFSYHDLNLELIIELVKLDFENKNRFFAKNDIVVLKTCEDIQKYIYRELLDGVNETDIFYNLIEIFEINNSREIFKIYNKILKEFDVKKNINSLIIPTIVYNGPTDELADIFYHLNTGGENLSKYETYSASWGNEKFVVNDEQIINKIFEKYKNLKEQSDLEVDVSLDDLKNEGITIFEYCYSISEILRGDENKYNLILGKNKKSTDPVGFEILSLICGLNVNKADLLYEKFKNCNNSKFLVDLKNAIVKSFDEVLFALKPWIIAKNGQENIIDSTYMIYHMVMSYFRANFRIDLDEYKITIISDKKWNDKFKNNLYLYYFKDSVSDFWKINRQVQDLMREINTPERLNKYVKTISNGEWHNALMVLRHNQLEEVTTKINVKAKLFIDYLVKFKIKENRELEKYFEINIDYEHIIPQQRFSKHLTSAESKVFPISSLGNICYLSYKDNRSKHEKTLYEYSADRPSFILNNEYLSLITYPSKEEINFIENRSDEFRTRYKEFIEMRLDLLIDEMEGYLKKI